MEFDASLDQPGETITMELSSGFGLNSDEIYSLLLDAKAAGHRLLSLSDAWHNGDRSPWAQPEDFCACPVQFSMFLRSFSTCCCTKDFLNMMRLGGLVQNGARFHWGSDYLRSSVPTLRPRVIRCYKYLSVIM